eukprot:4740621-Amphidinium_carterae.1
MWGGSRAFKTQNPNSVRILKTVCQSTDMNGTQSQFKDVSAEANNVIRLSGDHNIHNSSKTSSAKCIT